MIGDEAIVALDDVVPAEKSRGQVTTLWQTGFAPAAQPDKRSAILAGKQGCLWLGTFGPELTLQAEAPHEFGKSWVYRDLAEQGLVDWHTLKGSYLARDGRPLVTVLMPIGSSAAAPRVIVAIGDAELKIRFPSGRTIGFERVDNVWQWKP